MDGVILPKELAEKKIFLVKEDPFFISCQGEGSRTGKLTAWMRTTTCNLRCAWNNGDNTVTLCDTAYSSHKPSKHVITTQEAFDYLINNNCSDVCLTGGEPTIQQSVYQLVDYLEDAGKRVTIETNGTNFFESKATLISLSPKLESSASGLIKLANDGTVKDTDGFLPDLNKVVRDGMQASMNEKRYKGFLGLHEQNRYNLESFKKYMEYYSPDRYQFKFVVNTEEDIEEIIKKYVEPLNIPNDNIYLMPQGMTHEQLNKRAEWVVEQCKKHGWNYSDRVHVRIWGNKVGV